MQLKLSLWCYMSLTTSSSPVEVFCTFWCDSSSCLYSLACRANLQDHECLSCKTLQSDQQSNKNGQCPVVEYYRSLWYMCSFHILQVWSPSSCTGKVDCRVSFDFCHLCSLCWNQCWFCRTSHLTTVPGTSSGFLPSCLWAFQRIYGATGYEGQTDHFSVNTFALVDRDW